MRRHNKAKEAGMTVMPAKDTLVAAVEAFIDYKALDLAQTTIYGYKNIFENHIKPYFKDMPIQVVTLQHLQDYRVAKTKELSANTIGNLDGSRYVKTASDYKNDTLRNYVLNYYSKLDKLYDQLKKGERVTAQDIDLAMNVLRLEVQCGFQFLKSLQKEMRVGNTFGELFSYTVAYRTEQMIYKQFFDSDGTEAFYTYEAAKKLLPPKSEAARKTLMVATRHSITDQKYAYARKQIKAAGIYPHCFIAKNLGIERLDNPLMLIAEKLKQQDVTVV